MDLHSLTITTTKKALKEKQFSAVELTKAYLERINLLEPKLNSFVTITEEKALSDAKKADDLLSSGQDLPLLGIPLALKDNFSTKDIRTTASSKVLDDYIPPFHSTVSKRLSNAGTILLGKTNLDAWAHGSSTETSDYGVSRNPWDTTRLPGGSSGGSSAAVAADESLVAIGSETAGSIRLPAGWCGVVGLKPTYGRVSRYGVIAMASSIDSPGPITKTIEDTALMLEILAGQDEMDATSSPYPIKKYSQLMKNNIQPMTIGISDDYFTNVDPQIVKAIEEALEVFRKKGHKIKKIKLFDPKYAIDVYTVLQRSEVSSNLARMDGIRFGNDRSFFGEEAKRRIMLGTFALSSGHEGDFYNKARKVRTIIIEDFAKAFKDVDIIVGPTTPVTALPIGSTKDNPMFGEMMDLLMEPSSIAGICGISIPAGFDSSHLPIGMQIIGPQFGEEIILSLAYQHEQETEFWKEKPEIKI